MSPTRHDSSGAPTAPRRDRQPKGLLDAGGFRLGSGQTRRVGAHRGDGAHPTWPRRARDGRPAPATRGERGTPGLVPAPALPADAARAEPGPAAGRRLRGALRGATPLALAGLLSNVANLGVTLVIARAMSTRAYGATAQLVALFMIVSMPGSALLVGVVRRVTGWARTGRAGDVAAWAARVRRAGLAAVAAVALATLALRAPVAEALSLPDPGGVAQTLTAGAAWCLLCVDRGLLQAAHRYRALSANLLVDAAVKSTATVALVLAGLGQAGAATAILLGVLAALGHARRALRTDGPGTAGAPAGAGHARERRLLVELGAALVALACLALLQNIDVLVQGRLAPSESGQYAAVSVTCKVLMFGAVVLAGFLLPEAADRRHLGEHALHQLGATLAILAAPAALLIAVASAAPASLLSLAFGPRFADASGALLPLAGAMTCLGATVLFTHYLLALGSRAVLVALGLTAAAAAGLITLAGGSPVATARIDLAVQAALAAVTGFLVLSAARRTISSATVTGEARA